MVKFVHFLFLKDVLPALLSINGSVYDFCRGFAASFGGTTSTSVSCSATNSDALLMYLGLKQA